MDYADVVLEKENIHSMSGDGELMLTILASFAQEESRSVSENCKWRIRKRFADGELVNLRFMYGYHIVKGEVEINPEEADIVRMIFDDYLSGMGCNLIARKLREMNVIKLRGGTWKAERVADIIKNEKYAGNALLQKKYVEDHLTKSLVKNKGVLPKYYAENTHPPIVEADIFFKAQEIMAENRKRNAGKSEAGRYPFTSKIVCGICGKNYKRKTRHDKVFWNCSTYLALGMSSCSAKQIPESILIDEIIELLELEEFDEAVFKKHIRQIYINDNNRLEFIFHDRKSVEQNWQYKSRSEGWTKEKRQIARDRSYVISKTNSQ
jgi:site-specific DNA recombinase